MSVWEDLTRMGVEDIRAEGIPEEKIAIQLVADVRYFGEGHEVKVDIPTSLEGADAVAYMWKQFHGVHDQTFGFNYEGEQDVELVNQGMPFRDAYKKVGRDIEAGQFTYDTSVNHTHEGSIGNLCTAEIKALMNQVLSGFPFEKVRKAVGKLVSGE